MSSLWSQTDSVTEQLPEDAHGDHATNLGDVLAVAGIHLPLWPPSRLAFDKHLSSGGTFEVSRELHIDLLDANWTPYYVAVKRMRLDENGSRENRKHYSSIIRELQVLTYASLRDHASIIRLLGYGWTSIALGSNPYLVVEYSEYGTVADFLQNTDLDIGERHDLALDVGAGLKALHDCKVIHGDLKPHNVLVFGVASNERAQVAKLADFGNSVFEGSDYQRVKYGGTPVYKAPELDSRGMYKGIEEITHSQLYQADIYSFGLTIWEIVNSGAQYFEDIWLREGESRLDALRRICDEEINGMLSRARKFMKRQFRHQQPSVIHVALLKTFGITLRDDADERCSMSRVIEALAHGLEIGSLTEATDRPRSSTTRMNPSTNMLHDTPSLQIDSAPSDYVGPRLTGIKLFRDKSFYPSRIFNKYYIEKSDNDQRLQRRRPVSLEPVVETPESQKALVLYVKPRARLLSQPYRKEVDFFHTALAPITPWEIQCDIFNHLERTAQGLDKASVNATPELSQVFFQLAMCYHLGFGIQRDIKAMLQCLTNGLMGNYTSKAIYKRVITALIPYLGPEVNHVDLDYKFMTKADAILDAHDKPDTYFAARISTYAHNPLIEKTHWSNGISLQSSLAEVVKIRDFSAVSNALKTRKLSARDVSIALCVACQQGNADLTMLLCDHLECLDMDPAQPTPLHWLMTFDSEQIERVACALVLGANENPAGPCKNCIDAMPAVGNDIFFLEEHCADFFGAPLHWAVRARNLQLVELLIRLGTNINIRWTGQVGFYAGEAGTSLPNLSPLDLAIAFHLPEIVKVLLNAGAELCGSQFNGFMKNSFGAFQNIGLSCTPLSRYIIHGAKYREAMRKCIDVLIDQGYTISEGDSNGYNALMLALRDCDCESYIIEELISAGAPLADTSLDDGSNNAHLSAANALERRYNVSNLALVAPHVHDINRTDKSGRAPIHLAAIAGSDAMVEIICNCFGSNVDVITSDTKGRNALQYAAIFGSVDVLNVLIRHDAKKEYRDHDGVTALQLAIIHRQRAAADRLLEVGAEFLYQSGAPRSCTALHDASGCDFETSILPSLLETHPKLRDSHVINAQDSMGWTPLHWAVQNGNLAAAEALLDYGANRNIRDYSRYREPGKTPLDLALWLLKSNEPIQFPKLISRRGPQASKAYVVKLTEIKRLLEIEDEEG